ncbi:VOC family protein [Neobacillus mesonae]|uniref:VOC family protein n=1 Tax=Neobacillus mesonae TaxID=1193713 RepID=UPI002573A8AE|nr:VOC family protein [Neobacillus mesonae]
MQKIVPHLWYDKEAKEAALFYISLFENSKLLNQTVIENTPSGDSELVSFELAGLEFMAISAGPYFKFNPSISLMVACESVEEVNTKWEALVEGGTELMPLGEYPFSKWYGWIQDRFGLSWQLMLTDQTAQKITPNFLFSGDACGKAEEAINFYTNIFEDSEIGYISYYGEGEAVSAKAKVNYAAFKLCGMHFSVMDNAYDVDFNFNEAFSLIVNCKDQKEIDYFWDQLSAVPESEQCGWVKDQFGLSWQIVPDNMNEVMYKGSREENLRVMEALYKMKKIDLETLEKARLKK